MSCAPLTASATLGLASNVWGSVLGFFKIEVTLTYFPPIWLSTFAYWFSAPMALIIGVLELALAAMGTASRPSASAVAEATPRRVTLELREGATGSRLMGRL
jgi:hypothetical protein